MSAKQTLTLLAILGLMSCSGGGNDEPDGDGEEIEFPIPDGTAPSAATLVFPENNKECTEGTVLNNLESTITFQWNASENTDSYELNIRYLESNVTAKVESQTNEASVTLERGVGYEWFVISRKDNSTDTASSARWKFYNQSDGVQSYAPFPAEAVSPTRGKTLETPGNISLQWLATDVDNDISGYEVFFGTTAVPTVSLGTTQQSSVTVTIVVGQTYYWSVKTTDSAGNSSRSEVFDFSVR